MIKTWKNPVNEDLYRTELKNQNQGEVDASSKFKYMRETMQYYDDEDKKVLNEPTYQREGHQLWDKFMNNVNSIVEHSHYEPKFLKFLTTEGTEINPDNMFSGSDNSYAESNSQPAMTGDAYADALAGMVNVDSSGSFHQ